jgi:hypothetical protein
MIQHTIHKYMYMWIVLISNSNGQILMWFVAYGAKSRLRILRSFCVDLGSPQEGSFRLNQQSPKIPRWQLFCLRWMRLT